jgi:hypothetical protein
MDDDGAGARARLCHERGKALTRLSSTDCSRASEIAGLELEADSAVRVVTRTRLCCSASVAGAVEYDVVLHELVALRARDT